MLPKAEVRPIRDLDVGAVADFLHRHLNARVSPTAWARAMAPAWSVDPPNRGFMLTLDGTIVGAYLAIYSDRHVGGQQERFCNLAAFCVLPDYRSQGLLLARALLRQPGYTFTDLSPSGNVVALNERLGFRHLDTTTVLLVNRPWAIRGAATVSSDPTRVERRLTEAERRLFIDHRSAAAARHILISVDNDHCYVIVRHDRRKRLPLFVTVLYVSNPDLLRRHLQQFTAHLLLRHGAPLTLAETRIVGFTPGGHHLPHPRSRMFKSDHLDASAIDYLYSELVCVAW